MVFSSCKHDFKCAVIDRLHIVAQYFLCFHFPLKSQSVSRFVRLASPSNICEPMKTYLPCLLCSLKYTHTHERKDIRPACLLLLRIRNKNEGTKSYLYNNASVIMPYVLLNARFHLKHFKFLNLEIACFWCWVFVNVAIKLSDLISILELSATDHGLTKEDKRSHTHTHIHIIITCSHTIQCKKMKCHL